MTASIAAGITGIEVGREIKGGGDSIADVGAASAKGETTLDSELVRGEEEVTGVAALTYGLIFVLTGSSGEGASGGAESGTERFRSG